MRGRIMLNSATHYNSTFSLHEICGPLLCPLMDIALMQELLL